MERKYRTGKPDSWRIGLIHAKYRIRMILPATLMVVCIVKVFPQISIEECQKAAGENYPQAGRYGLIRLSEKYSLENAAREYLPKLSLSGKATYQSDTTSLPFEMPGMTVDAMDRDQYLATAEISQLVWDGGAVAAGRKSIRAQAEAEKRKTDSDIYSLRDRINNLYFGVLLIDEKMERNRILASELERNLDLVNAYIKSGTAARPDADAVMVEILGTEQRQVELYALRKAYLEMLSLITGLEILESDKLLKPGNVSAGNSGPENLSARPEMRTLAAREALLESTKSGVFSTVMPKISVFMQGGYGRPALDMLENDFSFFHIGGVRVVWDLGGLYSLKNRIELINTDMETIRLEREAFLVNAGMALSQAENEIEKIRVLLEKNDEIIRLRGNIKNASEEKVKNGTLSVSELLRDIHSFEAAVQDKAVNEIMLVKAAYDLKFILNDREQKNSVQGELE